LTESDTVGDWFDPGALTDITVHIYGGAGASEFNGATVKIMGTNEEEPVAAQANAAIVDDLNGTPLAFTATAIEGVGPVPRKLCPKVTAGTLGATGVTIHMIARKQSRG
jgi:hypothetical protein